MVIADIAPLIVPVVTALGIVIQNIGNRRSIVNRISRVEMRQLLLMMHDIHRPLSERLDAGKQYIDLGGNGSGAAYYEKLKEAYQQKVSEKMEDIK